MSKREGRGEAISSALDSVPKEERAGGNSRNVERQARRTEAVAMALAGATYEQIGERLGISSQGAQQLVSRTLSETRNYEVDALRKVENARLDRAQAAIWSKVIEGDEKSINTFLRISERRAKLNGLDAPSKVEMALSVRQEMESALSALEEIIVEAEIVEESNDTHAEVAERERKQALEYDYGS